MSTPKAAIRASRAGSTTPRARKKAFEPPILLTPDGIYPAELENVLTDCAAIAEAAVIGFDDPKSGEAACACIVRRKGSDIGETEILNLFSNRLAKFESPKRVLFLDSLPKNAMGNVQKLELSGCSLVARSRWWGPKSWHTEIRGN